MMVRSRGCCDRNGVSPCRRTPTSCTRPMREARQAVAAMRASVATNSAKSAHFSDRVEKDIGAPLMCATITCGRVSWSLATTEEH
jgi:hypothetical protein